MSNWGWDGKSNDLRLLFRRKGWETGNFNRTR
jgi:hypothetical protein